MRRKYLEALIPRTERFRVFLPCRGLGLLGPKQNPEKDGQLQAKMTILSQGSSVQQLII